jgi:very-short-patch-repair endonuclease
MITRTKTYKEKAPKRDKTELEKLKAKAKREKWENHFDFTWKALSGPELAREHQFTEDRKWRFDFAELRSKVAIEVEGGTWSGGRHTRGSGYSADCEKYNEATRLGWRVFRLTPGMITVQHLEAIMRVINSTSYDT